MIFPSEIMGMILIEYIHHTPTALEDLKLVPYVSKQFQFHYRKYMHSTITLNSNFIWNNLMIQVSLKSFTDFLDWSDFNKLEFMLSKFVRKFKVDCCTTANLIFRGKPLNLIDIYFFNNEYEEPSHPFKTLMLTVHSLEKFKLTYENSTDSADLLLIDESTRNTIKKVTVNGSSERVIKSIKVFNTMKSLKMLDIHSINVDYSELRIELANLKISNYCWGYQYYQLNDFRHCVKFLKELIIITVLDLEELLSFLRLTPEIQKISLGELPDEESLNAVVKVARLLPKLKKMRLDSIFP